MKTAKTISRKFTLLNIFFICFVCLAYSQETFPLEEVKKKDKIKSNKAIIYGNFVQRLSTNSIGFPQEVRIVNINTSEVFSFTVKPTMNINKENPFCYFLSAGNYMILDYWWTDSKWYGGNSIIEPIYNGIDSMDSLREKIDTNRINPLELKRFTFKIDSKSVNYLGTWHFDTGHIYFSNDKSSLDKNLKKKYKYLDLPKARTVIPQ